VYPSLAQGKIDFHAILQNEIKKLVSPKHAINIIDFKWLFKVKQNFDGSIEHCSLFSFQGIQIALWVGL
jgi:hypothetical protein